MSSPSRQRPLRILIAFGPTEEPLDPVRYLTNRSTGTMGRRLAEAARARGHRVQTVECPKDARTALRLQSVLEKAWPRTDVLFMAAAVCDVRPERTAEGKLRKTRVQNIRFVKNPDILAGLGRRKKDRQVLIGFAIESASPIESGFRKLRSKNLELIVVQKVTINQDPFGEQRVNVWLLDGGGGVQPEKAITKIRLAALLVREAERLHAEKN